MKLEPVGFVWDASAMIPLDRFRMLASRQYAPGREYTLLPPPDRSDAAHGLLFGCINLAWNNLPEVYAGRFPSPEYLRKWCLVKEGFADEHSILCANEAQAVSVAKLSRELDGFAIIQLNGPIVTVWTAKSMTRHSMNHEAFTVTMNKILERLANMLGITVDQLTDEAKSAMKRKGTS